MSTRPLRRRCSAASHVWLLAPTWIAVNASIGLWFSQSIFQFAQGEPRLPRPAPDARLQRRPDLARRRSSIGARSSAPGCSTGATASRRCGGRRSSPYGIVGGAVARRWPASSSTTRTALPLVVPIAGAAVAAASGCSCSPARRRRPSACSPTCPSASRRTAARSWACTRVFLALGQIIGSLLGGVAADWRGHRRHARRDARSCSASRSLPLSRLRGAGAPARPEHPSSAEPSDADARRTSVTAERPLGPGAARPRRRTARSSRRTTSRPRPGSRSCGPAGHAVDAAIATNAVLGVVLPVRLRDRRRRVLADLGRGRGPADRAERLRPGAGRGRRRRRSGPAGSRRSRSADRSAITVPGAVRSWGDAHARLRAAVAGGDPRARRSSSPGTGFPAWDGFIDGGRDGRCRPSSRRSARTPASSGSTGRTAGRGDRASGSGCRPWRRRSSALADVGFDAFYEGDLGERQARGLAAAGSPITADDLRDAHLDVDRADRDRLPRRPGHDPPAEQLRDRRPRAAERSSSGSSRRRRRAFGPDGVDGRRAGSTSASRRPSWRWPIATRT